jgi:hypothetical protein
MTKTQSVIVSACEKFYTKAVRESTPGQPFFMCFPDEDIASNLLVFATAVDFCYMAILLTLFDANFADTNKIIEKTYHLIFI